MKCSGWYGLGQCKVHHPEDCCISCYFVVVGIIMWWGSTAAYWMAQVINRGRVQRVKVLKIITKTLTNVLFGCIRIDLSVWAGQQGGVIGEWFAARRVSIDGDLAVLRLLIDRSLSILSPMLQICHSRVLRSTWHG